MERAFIAEQLAQAERHVAQGQRHIAEQRERTAELQAGGHDTDEALKLLAQFQELQELRVQHRDWLRKELAESSD